MMSMANNNNNNGADYMRLKAELGALNEALSQCQADKEFVWSLWKRLQVASPDVTQAISLVVQREREKVEKGNRRVLEMLHSKDAIIDKLQKTLSVQTRALSDRTNRSAELERELAKLLATHNDLQHKQRILQDEVTNEKRISASRLAIRDLDKENLDLKQHMSKLEAQLESMSKQNEELLELTESQRLKSKNLESDHDEVQQNYDHIMSELSDAKKRLRQSEQKLRESTREATGKSRELELVRKELSDVWVSHSQTTDHTSQQADLIRQLQTLHKDTRQMLKNQEDTFTMENAVLHTKLEKMEETESDLRQQHAMYEQKIQEQQDMIVGLRKKLSDAEDDHHHHPDEPPPASYSVKTSSASDRLSQSTPLYSVRSRGRQYQATSRLDDARTRHVSPCQSPGSRRDQSPYGDDHREFDVKMLRQLLTTMEKKLNHYHQLLHVKDDELKELKVAHSRRLERLRSVVTNYKLVKKQLRIVEEECYG